ncbi:uncharacterized protein LOC114786362 [Denticeps clupeoides]|uniref:uncharacterized protein LOC114786362 n=1 Tax=Denticeps clupeoides TaxID=299321 RepID=UPI0010A35756|nr:uncharacterized protein LOC114786362 [Denticeps clupeoides]
MDGEEPECKSEPQELELDVKAEQGAQDPGEEEEECSLDSARTAYKKRFTREEESALYQEVLKHWYELFGDRRHAVPRGSRASVWNNIAATLGATFTSREGDDVRKKWNTLKNQLVAKLAVIEATNNADWGETPVPDLTDLEEAVASKMRGAVSNQEGGKLTDGDLTKHLPAAVQETERPSGKIYNKRFTREEEEILYVEVLNHWEELFGERSYLLRRGGRASIWNGIAAKVSSTSGVAVRDGEDVRKKWHALKKQLKAKVDPILSSSCPRDLTLPELNQFEEQIASKMKKDGSGLDFSGAGSAHSRRFTKEEEEVLYTEVLNHWDVLFGERSYLLPRGSRMFFWTNIAAKLNATAGARPRDAEELRKKWHAFKNQLKGKLAPAWASAVGTGDSASAELTELEEKIAAKMKLSVPGPGVISSAPGPGTSHGSVEGEDDDSDSSDREAAVPSPPETLQPEQAIPSPSAQLTPERVQAILDRQRENNRLLAQTLHIQQASLDIQRSCLEALKDVREVLSGLLAVQQARLEMDMGPSRSMAGTLPRPVLAVLTPPERSSSLSNHIHPDSSSHLSDTHNDPKSNPSANTDSVFHQTPVTCSLRVSLPYTLPQGFTSGANPPSPSWSDSMQHLSPDCPSGRDPPVPNNLPVSYRQGHGGGRRGRPPKTKIMTTSPKGSKKCKRT